MPKITLALILLSLLAAAPARAADEPAKKGSNKLERAVEKAGAAMGRTADKVEKSVKKGAAATEKGIHSAGNKTGAAVGKVVGKAEKKVAKGAAATGKALDSAGKKTERWVKEKTD